VLSPRGQILFKIVGEGYTELLSRILSESIRFYKEKSLFETYGVAQGALAAKRSAERVTQMSSLNSPSKLALDSAGSRLFVSDSGNGRIIILSTKTLEVIGQIEANFKFQHGLAFHESSRSLIVADTGNHSLKSINVDSGNVLSTICFDVDTSAGTKPPFSGAPSHKTRPSPWDVVIHGDFVYVAMAGFHQVWNLRIRHDGMLTDAAAFAGNGLEKRLDSHQLTSSSFAQPSGLTILYAAFSSIEVSTPFLTVSCRRGDNLYVADAESSSVRVISLSGASVRTLCGGDADNPNNLFAYGDVDHHVPSKVRFQHLLSVCAVSETCLLVADSYNGKIKRVNPATGHTVSLQLQGDVRLKEPDGIVFDHQKSLVIVVDSAANAVMRFKLEGDKLTRI
jgi:sugar lactone lactonase YvrE